MPPNHFSPEASKRIGSELARFVQRSSSQEFNTSTLQAVIADLVGDYVDLAVPLKDLVSRQSFRLFVSSCSTAHWALQRDALINEISHIYHPAMLSIIKDILNEFLEKNSKLETHLLTTPTHNPSQNGSTIVNQLQSNENFPAHDINVEQIPYTQNPQRVKHVSNKAHPSQDIFYTTALQIAARQGDFELTAACQASSNSGLINYLIRDNKFRVLARVPMAMINAQHKTPQKTLNSFQRNKAQSQLHISAEQWFQQALLLAKRLGNQNLDAASAILSTRGLMNYIIRDTHSRVLAKVPMSMIKNSLPKL